MSAQQALHGSMSCFIVTRNSHGKEIREFLILNGMSDLAECVLVVPKKKSKGSFIWESFYANGDDNGDGNNDGCGNRRSKTCLVIDDDIRELVGEDWLREDLRVHRLLFVRGFS